MSELRFDGRVAVVTGAGRGIGRAYAQLLAARGASVVVNDLGGSSDGDGSDVGPANEVAAEIVDAGGTAIGNTDDVSTADGADGIVGAALREYGRIDIVVNNAGIIRWGDLPDADAETLQRTLDVHLFGSFNVTRAAWPHLVEQQYGRVVMTTSTGMLGLRGNLAYAAAKGGTVGMARNMRLSGDRHGIKVNLIAPAAATRMGGDSPDMAPELVAPIVAYLCHEGCPVSGEIYVAGAGRFSRLFIGATQGYLHDGDAPAPEDIAANWSTVNDESDYYVPGDLPAWAAEFMRHIDAS